MFNESIVSDIVYIVYKLTQYYIFVKINLRLEYLLRYHECHIRLKIFAILPTTK